MERGENIIINDIPFKVDRDLLLMGMRLKEGSREAARLEVLVKEAESVARPKAFYRMAWVGEKSEGGAVIDGIFFASRVLGVNLEKAHHVFPFIVTCGLEIEKWAEDYADFLERYWADTLMASALGCALQALEEHLKQNYQPGKTSMMNPGSLEDWPITEQKKLFELAGEAHGSIGVSLSDRFLMVPLKSISGIIFSSEEGFVNCRLCPREACPGRRAPYDVALYEKKFR